jgi:hypothetical protein
MPLAAGDEILSGRLFRRIQNFKSRFNEKIRRPKIGAFRPDPLGEWFDLIQYYPREIFGSGETADKKFYRYRRP